MKWFSATALPLSPASCSMRSPTGPAGCRSRAHRWPSFCCCGPWGGLPSCSPHVSIQKSRLFSISPSRRYSLASSPAKSSPDAIGATCPCWERSLCCLQATCLSISMLSALPRRPSSATGSAWPPFSCSSASSAAASSQALPATGSPSSDPESPRRRPLTLSIAPSSRSSRSPWWFGFAHLSRQSRLGPSLQQVLPLACALLAGAGKRRCASHCCGFFTSVMDGWRLVSSFWQSTASCRCCHQRALHALTAGAIGIMTLAVMTRASLGHTGRPLVAGHGTKTIYVRVTLAALLRLLAPLGGTHYVLLLTAAGAAWSGAFGLFVLLYAHPLALPRVKDGTGRPI